MHMLAMSALSPEEVTQASSTTGNRPRVITIYTDLVIIHLNPRDTTYTQKLFPCQKPICKNLLSNTSVVGEHIITI